ncbi:Nuclear receptor corepressor 2-like [Mycena sanguinolenta]|uniref:Nuclear receptor corepressor 2-like n=1 Tax=Mycena sanguinolenta TaxID=230812 RepID=A0A8H7CR73_9AGAR|nr:Nuclear receptor corepressor 2-like [Mycena sanguinolenta]
MMSSGGYPFPPGSSASNILPPRRASGSLPLSYDRPLATLLPHRSPSPGSLRRHPYDDYPGPRAGPQYRDYFDAPQKSFRPDPHAFRPQSPSRYPNRAEPVDLYPWDPPRQQHNTSWSDRRALTLSPTSPVMSRDRVRSDPPRMFEPSNAWKQTQGDRSVSMQSPKSDSVERYGDRVRSFRDKSPERATAMRSRSPPYFGRGDRYRPDQNSRGNGRTDSYRPNYDSARLTGSSYRPNYNSSPRRRAASPNGTISSSRSSRSSRSRSRSRSRSTSQLLSFSKTANSLSRGRSTSLSDKRRTRSRSTSRSSIASTQVSNNPPSRHISPVMVSSPVPAVNGPQTLISASRPSDAPVSSTLASAVVGKNADGPSPTPSPIPGIHSSRTSQIMTAIERHDCVAQHDLQHPLKSPVPVPGLGNALRTLDVDVSSSDPQSGKQPGEILLLPLAGEKRSETNDTVLKPKTAMPTWDVEPTTPAAPIFVLSPSPSPIPVPVHAEPDLEPIAIPATSPATPPAELDAMPDPDSAMDLAIVPATASSPEPAAVLVVEPPGLTATEPPAVTATELPSVTATEPLCLLSCLYPSPPLRLLWILPTIVGGVQPRVDFVPEDIPPLTDATSIDGALRTVVMTRLLRDNQTRAERIQPVLMENLSIALPVRAETYSPKVQDQLIAEVSLNLGSLLVSKGDGWPSVQKTEQLQLEYKALHQRWRRHCEILDQQAKPIEPVENVPISGRTTRRSAATLGDTVRSDLEMEQIIASLGYDEAMDPNQLSTKNLAIIPDMISVTGETAYTFDDTNHQVENPSEYYAPCTGIHDWTDAEKEIFLDKYAAFPKQFGIIAESLPNKTPSQCIDYYYLHKKKLIDFRRAVSQFAPNKRRRRTGRQKGNGLLSDIRQHDAEVLGDFDDSPSYTGRATRGRRIVAPEPRKPSARRNVLQLEDVTTATPTPEPEARPKRRRVAASRSVLFQDDLDDDDDSSEPKKKKRGRKPKSATVIMDEFATPIPTPPIPEIDTLPMLDPSQLWSSEDKALFLDLFAQHGENFKRIAVAMPTKARTISVLNSAVADELDLVPVLSKAKADAAGDASISGRTSPFDMGVLSAPSPSTSVDRPGDGSAEPRSNPPPQNDDPNASPVLDPAAMWDSMDPGSGARSPRTAAASPGPGTVSADPGASAPGPVLPAPPMAFFTQGASGVEPTSEANASRSPLIGASASISANKADDQQAAKPPVKDGPEQPKYPIMSSLNYDPVWAAYYDPNGANRSSFAPHYPEAGSPTHPYPPSGPVPYATAIPPPGRPLVGAVGSRPPPPIGSYPMPYPYYIPPPYPSASYHPYSSTTSYKS